MRDKVPSFDPALLPDPPLRLRPLTGAVLDDVARRVEQSFRMGRDAPGPLWGCTLDLDGLTPDERLRVDDGDQFGRWVRTWMALVEGASEPLQIAWWPTERRLWRRRTIEVTPARVDELLTHLGSSGWVYDGAVALVLGCDKGGRPPLRCTSWIAPVIDGAGIAAKGALATAIAALLEPSLTSE